MQPVGGEHDAGALVKKQQSFLKILDINGCATKRNNKKGLRSGEKDFFFAK